VTIAPGAYLRAYLEPLRPWLEADDVTDILINAPDEVFVERITGRMERIDAPGLDEVSLRRLAAQIAAQAHQGVSRETPLLSATLPGGERVQVIAPPATRGPMAMAIRKHVVSDLGLDDYVREGAFDGAVRSSLEEMRAADAQLQAMLDAGDVAGFLRGAVACRKNVLISGGTSTGKTTFLNALIKEIPSRERLIVIEDAPEVRLDRPNAVGLIAVRGDQGEARVTAEDLLRATLRMRPDRIILGELRGGEAFSFLRAVNSGHPGSFTTVHADTPDAAIEQIALMVVQAGGGLKRADVLDYVRGSVEVAVQLGRTTSGRGVREVRFSPRSYRRAD